MTIKEFAKKCGVSPSTVSKVLNNYPTIPLETKRLVWDAMEKYDYIPNSAASSLATKKYNNIGILGFLSNEESPFGHPLFGKIIVSFQREINRQGYDLVFVDKLLRTQQGNYVQNCISRNISGVLIFGFIIDDMTYSLLKSDIKTVVFDYYGEDSHSVRSNSVEAMETLTDYVLDCGHKDVVVVLGDDNIVADYRLEGVHNSFSKHEMALDNYHIRRIPYYDTLAAYKMTQEIIQNDPNVTCIMFPDDYTACAAIKAANAVGKRVPEDISITGFDGTDVSGLLPHYLTTMKQDTDKIGTALAKNLIDLIKGKEIPQVTELKAILLQGETVKKLN